MATTTAATPPAATPATSTTSDGPTLTVIAKRIRALRKKHTRILQMEQSLSQGKTLNSEQLEVVRSKPVVEALIDELEKLRAPISAAVDEELSVEYHKQDKLMEDFVNLMYFGSLFDLKSEFTLYTKTLERGSCLTYDIVTDDAVDGDMLVERDLDLISALQGLMIARPANSELSHRNALDLCLKHAKLWRSNVDQPIDSQTNVTYAALRAKLNKIISSGYLTATPQMRGAGEVAAAAAGGNFGLFQVPTQESMVNVEVPAQAEAEVEGSTEQYKETEEDAGNSEGHETAGQQSSNVEVFQKDDLKPENPPEVVPSQTDQEQSQNTEGENGYSNVDFKDQQQYGNRRGPRGGGRGGGRRGYPNGRGGRGNGRGNGTYQNGRGQYHDNYYPRNNYYNRRGGRGGNGNGNGGGGYTNNSSGDHSNHSQENVGAAS
ncbi:uncharacterized protein LOC141644207 [Silene latifolia]|uniref:uncharacterized protein LOC141644207 n=1 Tax=Silene latifolia TaxID=37657 RepID=UPI003D76F471